MIISIVVALMVILVAAFWAYQGLFSAAVMLIDAAVACALAFGYYEAVNSIWSDAAAMQGIGQPLALMLLFLLSLFVLRTVTDKLVTAYIDFPLPLERAGGGLCGFFTGMILVGTALTAAQMMPIGSSVLGFERFKQSPAGRVEENRLGFFGPDAFAVGLVNLLSNGSFSGGNALGQSRPDLLLDLYAARSSPQAGLRNVLPPDCLRVMGYWEARQINQVEQRASAGIEGLKRAFAPTEPAGVNKFLVCRVQLDISAAEKDRPGEIRFRAGQFRIVGPPPLADGSSSVRGELYLACGLSDVYTHAQHAMKIQPDQPARLVRFGPMTDFILSSTATAPILKDGKNYEFDVVFEVPTDFTPWYVEFKRGARFEVTKNLFRKGPMPLELEGAAAEGSQPEEESQPEDAAEKVQVGEAPKGRTHVANAIEERTGVFAELPIVLGAEPPPPAANLRAGKLWEGHFWIEAPKEPVSSAKKLSQFFVPDGKRIVQVGVTKTFAENVLGKAMNYAANVAAAINITTSDGQQYFAQGVYSAAPVDGKLIFEIQYWPEAGIPERCLREPIKLKKTLLERAKPEDRKFGYIFLVDPGVEIASFSAGSSVRQDLKISVPG